MRLRMLLRLVSLSIVCFLMLSRVVVALPVYTEKDANNIINITPGSPQFIIQLPANPTTGYQWKFKKQDQDKELIKLIHYQFVSDKTAAIGAPGLNLWTFEITQKGFSEAQPISLKFEYARPWEKNISPAKEYLFKIIPID